MKDLTSKGVELLLGSYSDILKTKEDALDVLKTVYSIYDENKLKENLEDILYSEIKLYSNKKDAFEWCYEGRFMDGNSFNFFKNEILGTINKDMIGRNLGDVVLETLVSNTSNLIEIKKDELYLTHYM